MSESREIASVRNFDIGTKRQLALAPPVFREFSNDISSWFYKIANYLATVGEGSVTHQMYDKSGTVTWNKAELQEMLKDLTQKTPTMYTEQFKLGLAQPRSEGVKNLQDQISRIFKTEISDEERLRKINPLVNSFKAEYSRKKEERAANNTNGISAPRLVTDPDAINFIFYMLSYILQFYGVVQPNENGEVSPDVLDKYLPVFAEVRTVVPYEGSPEVVGRFMDAATLRVILNAYLSIVKYNQAIADAGGVEGIDQNFVKTMDLSTPSLYSTSIDAGAAAAFAKNFGRWRINPDFLARNSNTLAGTLLKNISYQLPNKDTKFTPEMADTVRKLFNEIKNNDYRLVKEVTTNSKSPEVTAYHAYDVINGKLGDVQVDLVAKYIQNQRNAKGVSSINSKTAKNQAKAYRIFEIFAQLSPENQELVRDQAALIRAESKEKLLIDNLFAKSYKEAEDVITSKSGQETVGIIPEGMGFTDMLREELASDTTAADKARDDITKTYNKFVKAAQEAAARNQPLSRKIGVKESKKSTTQEKGRTIGGIVRG